jgi:ubiquinone/menaquinone biosynthesis C-methylase UbiE
MKTEWDYTLLADAYVKRCDYAGVALDQMLALVGARPGDHVCDIGAGAAHLTLPLLDRGLRVTAVEPNDAMRAQGMARTRGRAGVTWAEGSAEETGQPAGAFALVTFGSSFNVTDRTAALHESARILKPQGWFACMWNHRDILDSVQSAIEGVILDHLPDYDYGSRREDQSDVITASGLFRDVRTVSGSVTHRQTIDDCVKAWRSHATLSRQAGDRFQEIVAAIERLLRSRGASHIDTPYTTRIWLAQLAM